MSRATGREPVAQFLPGLSGGLSLNFAWLSELLNATANGVAEASEGCSDQSYVTGRDRDTAGRG